jgi:DNA ligase-associated metallophosphoesterase
MVAAPLHLNGERLMLDPMGAAFWPERKTLIVADLHLEKASAAAARGSLLPPFDTRATLERLSRLMNLYRASRLIALGDSFHDSRGTERLASSDRAYLARLTHEAQFIWITGNHDAGLTGVAGECVAAWQEGPFIFRHQAEAKHPPGLAEISGHYHPKASIPTRAHQISRPCFATDGRRLVLPALGAFTGGLDIRDPAIASLFPRGLRAFLLGRDRLFHFVPAQGFRVMAVRHGPEPQRRGSGGLAVDL